MKMVLMPKHWAVPAVAATLLELVPAMKPNSTYGKRGISARRFGGDGDISGRLEISKSDYTFTLIFGYAQEIPCPESVIKIWYRQREFLAIIELDQLELDFDRCRPMVHAIWRRHHCHPQLGFLRLLTQTFETALHSQYMRQKPTDMFQLVGGAANERAMNAEQLAQLDARLGPRPFNLTTEIVWEESLERLLVPALSCY